MLLDKPLSELKTYTGRNPKPADHDAYWQRALEEQRATDPKAALTPAAFHSGFAECFDLFFTGVRGARIYAKLLRPKNIAGKAPAILNFHGYSMNSGDWFNLLPYVAAGYCVAAMDARGQGGRSEDVGGVVGNTLQGQIIRGLDGAPEDLLFRQIFLDTAQLFRVVTELPYVDEARVGTYGGSQGGALSLVAAALCPGIRRAVIRMPFLSDYQRLWEMDLAKDVTVELRDYFRRFDPRHERQEEIFTRLGYIDVQHLAPRIRAEVLFFTGMMDQVCPPSTQFAAYNRITAPKEMLIYPDYGHEPTPGYLDDAYRFLTQV